MFNQAAQQAHQQAQMIQMQRMMANRSQRSGTTSAFFDAGDMGGMMNPAMEMNGHHHQYMLGGGGGGYSQRSNFGGMGGQTLMAAGEYNTRVGLDSFGAANNNSGMMMNGAQQQLGMGGSSGFIGSVSVRVPVFKCSECNIVKNSTEELEIHIKTEHLGWLPFQCPICTAQRASDIQMREHMHSHHKKNENKFYYIDNPPAKRILQEMLDRALFGASQHMARKIGQSMNNGQMAKKPRIANGGGTDVTGNNAMAVKKTVGDEIGGQRLQQQPAKTTANNDVSAVGHGAEEAGEGDVEAQQQQRKSGGGELNNNAIHEDTMADGQQMFGRRVKSEFDMAAMDGTEDYSPDDQSSMMHNIEDDEDNLPDDNSNQMNALQNVAAMFSASGGSLDGAHQQSNKMNNSINNQSRDYCPNRRIVRNRPGPMTSKKRVLGLCADCNKPITAGARQMHMFYHLGRDMDTYRFRCKHSECRVQHYRKDQMENHQSKVHGKVDAEMMDDRSMELYNLVQEMSMKLLGTTGNTPGPTAAKAQVLYDQQMREMEANVGVRKRRRPEYFDNSRNVGQQQQQQPQQQRASTGAPTYDSANRRTEDLECLLCNKFILNRTRGFHILWHLNTDLGIVRYGCKYCNFKHDRPQSVAAHGSREHGDEGACEDLLYNYEDELKQMSKECFGVERLFEKEIRRRNKLERMGLSTSNSPSGAPHTGDGDDLSQQSSESKPPPLGRRRSHQQQQIANLKVPLKAETDRNWTPKEPVKKKRSTPRRFGARSN